MHSKILGLIAHLLCGTSGPPEGLPWDALPQAPDDDTQVEAVLVVRDLRALQGWANHVRGVLREVPVGEALTSPDTPSVWGFDLWHDVDAWLDLAAPDGAPVPAALTLMSTNGDIGWQGQLRADPNVVTRLRAAQATPVDTDETQWTLPRGTRSLHVQLDKQGWLRVAPNRHWLSGAATEMPLGLHRAQTGFAGHDVALVLLGQGTVAKRLLHLSNNPALHTLAEGLRAAGVAWRLGDAQTTQLRMLVDAPLLETLAPVLRKRQLVDPFTRTLGDDLQGLAVVALPPPFVKALPAWAETHLGGTAAALPANVHDLLARFEGHLAFVSYDAPGDWAVAAQFDSSTSAEEMVPALQAWAQQLASGLAPGGQQVLALEPFAGAGQVFHMRPEAHLEGPYIAARGPNVLFVQQRSRLQRLLNNAPPLAEGAIASAAPSADPNNPVTDTTPQGLLATPMTALMRDSLAAPHMVSGYKVLGSDAAWLDYLVWVAGRLQAAVQEERSRHPEDAVLSPIIDRLPQWVGALSYLWLCTYDMGVTADVLGSLLVVDVTHSEI